MDLATSYAHNVEVNDKSRDNNVIIFVQVYERVLACHAAQCVAEAPAFWDILVVTASDEQQCAHYETVIGHRVASGALPASMRVHVFPDPRGPKAIVHTTTTTHCADNLRQIGSGGATLLALHQLREIYTAEELDVYKARTM